MTSNPVSGVATRSAFTAHLDASAAAEDLLDQLGPDAPCAVLFFCSWQHDGAALSAALRERWPGTSVIGCTTAGAFTESDESADGVSAFALWLRPGAPLRRGARAVRRRGVPAWPSPRR